MSRASSDELSPTTFPTTQWSRVIVAGDPDAPLSRESLAELCNAYWYPLYAYIRRRGYDPEQAQDLTQDFFAPSWRRACCRRPIPPGGGSARSCGPFAPDFLANRRDWEHARKRGGGRTSSRSTRPVPRGGTRES